MLTFVTSSENLPHEGEPPMRSSITRVAAVAVPLASLISLTACRGVVVAASPGTGGTVTALATSSTAASTVTSAPATAAASSAGAARAARRELSRRGRPGARLGRHRDDEPPVEDLDGQRGCHLRADRRALP